jgi:hypothetical protein
MKPTELNRIIKNVIIFNFTNRFGAHRADDLKIKSWDDDGIYATKISRLESWEVMLLIEMIVSEVRKINNSLNFYLYKFERGTLFFGVGK